MSLPRLRATFTAQAWINDYANEVDNPGTNTWEVSSEHIQQIFNWHQNTYNRKPEEILEDLLESDNYVSDELRDDPSAPKWIQEWDGPFFVEAEVINE